MTELLGIKHLLAQRPATLSETLLLARITERSRRELAIGPGCALWAQVKAVALLA